MAIIAILIALLLPAVQQARVAARRSACKNNLKQLLLGMHNYESTYGLLPPGYLHKFGPSGADQLANHMGFAWGSMILPQIEQANLYAQFNFNVPIFDNLNRTGIASEGLSVSNGSVFRRGVYCSRPGLESAGTIRGCKLRSELGAVECHGESGCNTNAVQRRILSQQQHAVSRHYRRAFKHACFGRKNEWADTRRHPRRWSLLL